jgi:Cytochrome c554 and c-prime
VPRTRIAFLLLLTGCSYSACARPQQRLSDPVPRQTISTSPAEKPGHAGYAGDDVCNSCHQDKLQTFPLTAHHRTSQLPSADSIAGKFTPSDKTMKTVNPGLSFRMDAKDGGFYQTAVFGEPPNTKEHSEAFGIVIGSGGKGQTYLYWKGDELFQLPISYWTQLGQWVNSPGYLDGEANFDRPVPPRCVECHAAYFRSLAPSRLMNRFDRADFVLGISCERCHGPGQEHASRRSSRAGAAAGEAIANPATFSRDRQIDVCAQCHGGFGEEIAPAFSFKPGEPLANFIKLQRPAPSASVDVHGNQVALLARSRCFQSSDTMTCSTCHDEHAPERATASYSSRCLSCHEPAKCGMYSKLGAQIASNCIDCHMPVQQSKLIVSNVNGMDVNANVRNHWIKVYSESPGH